MNSFFRYMVCLALAFAIAISCRRQELCTFDSDADNAAIQLYIDWTPSGIDQDDIYNISLYAYPTTGGAPYVKISGNITQTSLSLPAGLYSLLLFNDTVEDIEGVTFADIDSRDEFSAEAIEEYLSTKIGAIAAWRMEEFEVTEEMVWCSYCGNLHSEIETVTLNIEPEPVTVQCIVTLGVTNLNNASTIECEVKGLSTGAYLFSNDRIASSETTNIYSMSFSSRTYDDEGEDGTTTSEITTFGLSTDSDQSYEVEISIILNSGELATFTRDVTDQVASQSGTVITIDLTSELNKIVLPESVGTGFGVESWGDNESVEFL